MQEIRVNPLDAQMLQRTGERLLDLRCDGGLGIVGQAMILSAAEREFGLQKQFIPSDQSARDRSSHRPPDSRFVIVAALVGGVDTAKTLLQSKLGEPLRFVFLPSGSVKEARYFNITVRQGPVAHLRNHS